MIDGKDELITKFVIMFCSVPYHFRLYLGGQKGRARNLSLVIKTLARTGTILSSYLRNRNLSVIIESKKKIKLCEENWTRAKKTGLG